MRSNCIIYALCQWWRAPDEIYIIIRPSHATRLLPHFLVTRSIENVEVMEFQPLQPKDGWRALFHAPFFLGRVRAGLGEEDTWKHRLKRKLRRARRFRVRR